MTEPAIDQIEYRWDSGDDLTGIATSLGHADFDRWNGMLRQYTGISGRGGSAAAEAPSSAVYLTKPDGTAALILRSRDTTARPLYDSEAPRAHGAGAGRLDLVARALIAPKTLLTARIAMRIAVSDPAGLFDPFPGQAARGALPRLSWAKTQENISSADSVERLAKSVTGLAPVIAAVLADPGRPVMVVVRPDDIRRRVEQSRALALLWASRVLLQPLLRDPDDGRDLFDWQPTFSTCEAPLSSGDGREGLWLTFRERGPDGPPVGEGPMVVHLDRPAARQGALEIAAYRLAEAYETYGDQCVSLVQGVVRGHRTLETRIEAVACSEEIARVLSPRPVVTIPRQPAPRPAPADPAVSFQRPPTPPPPPPVPDPVEARPEPVPPRADPYLVRIYQWLDAADDPRDFQRLLDWIAVRARNGGGLDRDGFATVMQIMERRRWFAARVSALDAPAERLADLIQPIFACEDGDGRLEKLLEAWHTTGRLSALIADALTVLAARLEPGRADWLAEHALRYGPPVARSKDNAALLDLVRLPAKWPAAVVGPLTWLSLALIPAVVVYLLLT